MESEVSVIVKPANQCGSDELHQFETLAKSSGEVAHGGLSGRIRNAELLGFYLAGGEIASIAAIKVPEAQYRTDVFVKSGKSEEQSKYSFEYGWAYTIGTYRKKGFSYSLATQLLASRPDHGIFATVRVGNIPARGLLHKLGFVELGNVYQGREEAIQVFVRGPTQNPENHNAG